MFRAIVFGMLARVLLTGAAPTALAELTDEALQKGVKATALVELPNRAGFGTAFCINPDGYFVTSRHAVARVGVGGKINIVLSPGRKEDAPIAATVIEINDHDDLALIHAPKANGTPALELGDSRLRETMRVTVFGYPIRDPLIAEKQRYPNISVNTGRITALRGDRNSPSFIQIDAQLKRGSSGGPLLDENGRVIGMIVSGGENAENTLAIPVSRVKVMLQRPLVTFEAIEVEYAARYEPVDLRIGVQSIVPGLGEIESVHVQVERPGEPAVFPATLGAEGRYTAQIVPLDKPDKSPRWRVEVEYDDGSVRGLTGDREIEFGDRSVKLSELRSIERIEGGVEVTMLDGKTFKSSLADAASLAVSVGGRESELKLSSARRTVVLSRVTEPVRITMTAIVKTKDGLTVRKEQSLRLIAAPTTVVAKANSLRIADCELYFFDGAWQKTPLDRIKTQEQDRALSLTYEDGPHKTAWVGFGAKRLEGDFSARVEFRGAAEIGIRPTNGANDSAGYRCGSGDGWTAAQITRLNGELRIRINGDPVEVSYEGDAKANLNGVLALTIALGKTAEIRNLQVHVGQGSTEESVASTSPEQSIRPIAPPPQLGAEPLVIDLPDRFTEVRSGGGGRYLILRQPTKKTLAVFDVSAGEIVKDIPLSSEQVLYAAGRDKLMVVLPGERLIQRWNLAALKRDGMVPAPGAKTPLRVLMGSASDGPLWLWPGGAIEPFDIGRMESAKNNGPVLGGDPVHGYTMLISADGSTATGWHNGLSSPPYDLMHVGINHTSVSHSPFGEGYNGRWMWPNADGSLIFGHGAVVFDEHFKRIAAEWLDGASIVPTCDRRYLLLVKTEGKARSNVSICTSNDRRIIYTLTKIENVSPDSKLDWGRIGGEPRVYYIPSANVLLTLPVGEKQIVLRRIDVPEELKRQGVDYLYVDSFAANKAYRGQAWQYQITAHASGGALTFKLESGPDGMTISSDGHVDWTIPVGIKEDRVSAIVSIHDESGKEVLHTINFNVFDRSSNND